MLPESPFHNTARRSQFITTTVAFVAREEFIGGGWGIPSRAIKETHLMESSSVDFQAWIQSLRL